jgi:hypothetical protein
MGHVMVCGVVIASAVIFIVVVVVVPGKWNLSSAVSGAAEVTGTVTAVRNGTFGRADYDQFAVTVRGLRV